MNNIVDITKPILKWVGGKTQIIQDVLELFPTEINNYYEPFLGGGSVLLGLLSYIKAGKIKLSGKVYANDINPNIIWLYKNIQLQPDNLITEIKYLVNDFIKINGNLVNRKPLNIEEAKTSFESYYFWIRNQFNSLKNDEKYTPKASAMLLFMNKTCFRGLYREGPNGFNVPYGNYKNPTIIDEKHIKNVSILIKDVIFTVGHYNNILQNPIQDDFIYLDPPYAPENNKSFVTYTDKGFNLEEHKLLFSLCNIIHNKGCKLLMSNSDVSLVKTSFSDNKYKIKVISCRRSINSKKPDAKTNEVLIKNY